MKANELRVSNLVIVNNPKYHPKLNGEPMIVSGINTYHSLEDSVSLNHIDRLKNIVIPAVSQRIEFIEPIPLTPEWLERLGWIKHETFYSKPYGRNGVAIVKYEPAYKSFCYQLGTGHTKVLDHVHQLQNLHYAISGTELTLTEKPIK